MTGQPLKIGLGKLLATLQYMLLPILIGLILFQYSIHPFDFPVLDKIIGSSHRLCIQLTQNHFPYNDFQTSLICGQSLKHSSFAPPLLNMGIIHLFVVSGFHVLFIENLLSKIFPKNFWLSFGILTLYGLACQFHPPITRALIHHFLKSLNLNYKLFWRTSHITLLSGLCVLILCPQWIHSASFVLSWTACIAMQFSLPTRLTPHAFFNHFKIYILLSPLLFENQILSPLSIFFNFLFSPLFSFVLFPITFLSVFLPFIQPLYLFIWQTVDQYFFTLAPTGIESSLSQWPQYCRWGYLLFLHLLHSKKRPFHEN